VKFIRQVVLAVSIAGLVAAVLRARGKENPVVGQGGWREVTPGR
jgi:hypothetical protein